MGERGKIMAMKKAELDSFVRDSVINTLGIASNGTQIGVSEYAIPVETPEGVFYAKVNVTAAQRTATKATPAFDLDVAVEKFNTLIAEREAKAAEREAKKAEKAAKAAKSED